MTVRILVGDCRDKLRELPDASVNCCVTSPPYFGLRDYGHEGQMGLEPTPDEFVAGMVAVFREVRRVLRDDGTLWLNIGDSYSGGGLGGHADNKAASGVVGPSIVRGFKPKDLIGIPWMLAFALRADGWYLRQDIIWSKPNPMPESVRDRCTKAHEYLFLLSKGPRYYFDADAIAEQGSGRIPGNKVPQKGADIKTIAHGGSGLFAAQQLPCETRNKRSVWEVATQPFSEAHFATYPPALIEPCILAGCPSGGTVLDPFGGAGTTGLVADRLQRNAILIELNAEDAQRQSAMTKYHSNRTDCSVTIELPWPPNELSGHHNAHWRVLQPIKKKHRAWAAMATLAADIPEPEGNGDIRVSATFYPPDKRTDRVNMPTRLKPYWDGIADALKVNDRRFLPTYHFAEPVTSARVVITVYAA